ncbi:YihY/virulence factor BrkB family protein [Cellulomonas sp. PhB143]|uniref:YihY/virulence factor BrkB family protein n=1 Tax=Cellulomonas sp. PhB143 TaxID=2485186 RepID=UPI000F4A9213|nr:YihY/virulence factor BrkB family protein [Cellulomonas sp. PhB143]ROS76944.1 membrane protein [Cellulomonas sp. PhB143]
MAAATDEETTSSTSALVTRGKRLNDLWKHSRPGRALQHYGGERGALLCGGIAFSALFSVFAALTIGYTAFATVLGSNVELEDRVFDEVNSFVPNLIDTGDGGMITPDQLRLELGWSTLVPALVLLWTAISFMTYLRRGVRAMFGLSEIGQSPVLSKVWALAGFVGLGIGVIVSTAASVVVGSLSSWLADLLHLGESGAVAVQVAGILASLVIDAALVVGIVWIVAGARPRARDLWFGALLAAVAFGVLRYLGTSVVAGSAQGNPILAPAAVIVTLLLLVNFVARVLLMVASWMADPPFVEPHPDPVETPAERAAREAAVRAGQGVGYPWSPVVRGVRRGLRPRARRLVGRGEALRPENHPDGA